MIEAVCASETSSTPTRIHGSISQKAVIFILSAVRTLMNRPDDRGSMRLWNVVYSDETTLLYIPKGCHLHTLRCTNLDESPWWWRQYAPLKRRLLRRDYTALYLRRLSSSYSPPYEPWWIALMMEAVCASETSSTPTRLHCTISQKAVIFILSAIRTLMNRPGDGGSTHIWNVGIHPRDYLRRLSSLQ
jgi:hypothetical protein